MVKKNTTLYVPEKGDIIWINFTPQAGKEQAGHRPALVISSSIYNRSGLMLVCPITSKVKGYPFEVPITIKNGIDGAVLADHVKNQDWRIRGAKFYSKANPDCLYKVQAIIAALLLK